MLAVAQIVLFSVSRYIFLHSICSVVHVRGAVHVHVVSNIRTGTMFYQQLRLQVINFKGV